MVVDMGSVILYLIGIFLLYLICRIFLKPLRWFLRLALSVVLGGIGIFVLNYLFGRIGWHLSLNPLTAMITGVLGIPGMILIHLLTAML